MKTILHVSVLSNIIRLETKIPFLANEIPVHGVDILINPL